MKNKQTTQIVILAVVLIGLVVVVFLMYGGKKPAPKNTAKSPTATKTAVVQDAPNNKADLSWVDPIEVAIINETAAKLRDPFENLAGLGMIQTPAPRIEPPIERPTVIPSFPDSNWGVKPPQNVVIPEPPPTPNFVLAGVFSARGGERCAVIKVNDFTYTLQEGESFPNLGWRLTRVSPYNFVVLTNNADTTRSITIQLSGGSPK